MKSPLDFLKKVIAIRKYLVRENLSGKPTLEVMEAMKPLEEWVTFWGDKAKDIGALKMIYQHQHAVRFLLPGGNARNAQSLRELFNQFINQYEVYEQSKESNQGDSQCQLQLFLRGGRDEPAGAFKRC